MEKNQMKFISRSEEFIMLAVWRLKENAYAVPIRGQLKKVTGKTWAFGALFVMLSRLEKKGMLESYLADPLPKRGGRSKRIYRLSSSGIKALVDARNVQDAVWAGIKDFPLQG
jgi:DNA-binding PadR family transcriptional regulator